MSLVTPASVQKLQTTLHARAKGSPNIRFYSLYDKVYRKDVLEYAYECCKANGGAAGVDGQTFEDIETYGVEHWLDELAKELENRTYQPLPVRRVYIPKPDGKQRPLGVPAIRDRTAETAAVLVLEPIFEADQQPEQYAYRRDRSALDAVRHVHKLINTGHVEIVDADLSSYFDTLPHSELLKSVARRVVDGAMLHLIKRCGLSLRLKKRTNAGTSVGVRAIETKVEGLHKGHRSVRCSAIYTCDGSCSAGRSWDTRSV
jgi:RNA-directed DNA polymerase